MIGDFIGFTFFFIFILPFEFEVSTFLIVPFWITTFLAIYGNILFAILYASGSVLKRNRLKKYGFIGLYISIACLTTVFLLIVLRHKFFSVV